jgi:hypothetical protein
MSELMSIVESLQETDAAVAHLSKAVEERPDDDVLRINAEAVAKRQRDLVRRLDYTLHINQAELIQYRVVRGWSKTYPVKAVAAAMETFQELVTAVFDAIRTTPKQRYRPSQENVELSTFDFVGAGPGSVIISLAAPNDRLLVGQTDLDETMKLVEQALSARESDDLKLLAGRIGIAAISKAYAWADASVTYGLDTQIKWGKSHSDLRYVEITLDDASIVKSVIENKSETKDVLETVEGILLGFDGSTSYFHMEEFDTKRDIRGSVAENVPKSWTTNLPYRAQLMKTVQIRYATGEEKETWTLAGLEPLSAPPPLVDTA